MVPKINGLGRSFAGVAAYCLHDAPEQDDRSPETSERVAWTDTRNLPTIRAERAARLMAATAKAAPDLKRLAGGARGGRKLAKPVLHYSLSWARDETPDRQEMSRAVDGSLEALGLEGHEALIVAHDDTRHPHVHVVANRAAWLFFQWTAAAATLLLLISALHLRARVGARQDLRPDEEDPWRTMCHETTENVCCQQCGLGMAWGWHDQQHPRYANRPTCQPRRPK